MEGAGGRGAVMQKDMKLKEKGRVRSRWREDEGKKEEVRVGGRGRSSLHWLRDSL